MSNSTSDINPEKMDEHVKLTINTPEMSEWECYMFGNVPGGGGLIYHPTKGNVPNWFTRLIMKVCFACTWTKNNEPSN